MPKFIDKTGMIFGQLTVLSRAENKGKSVYWNCKCSCGKEICVRGDRLTQSKVDDRGNPSCGHLRMEHVKETICKNLIGQKFGRLTVLEKTNKQSNNKAYIWKCQCECGNIVELPTDALTRKDHPTRSCGCLQKEKARDFLTQVVNKKIPKIGENINNFIIKDIELRPTNGGCNESWILSNCPICGTEKWFQLRYIKNEDTKSCGCISKSAGEEKIERLLKENNIPFQKEFRFQDCKYKLPLPFDFYIDNKYLIEFDGIQHYDKKNKWHDKDLETRDQIKNQYCKDNNIPLIRIPYTHYSNLCLEDLLLETTTFLIKN